MDLLSANAIFDKRVHLMPFSRLRLTSIAILIVLGFFQIPVAPDTLEFDPAWNTILKWLFMFAPLIPLAVVLIKSLTARPWPPLFVFGMASLTAIFGLLMSVLHIIFGSSLAFMHTLSLTIAIVAFLSVLNTGSISGLWSKLIIIPVVVAVWSISTIAVIAFQANKISGGDPFCLAAHKTNGEITNFAQLRGLSFYAPLRGKNALQWDFHGLLIVETDEGPVVYNWSPRWARFDVIAQPALYLVDPLAACVPKAD
ncbi:hypothetical protein [Epibacterium ulvae]|uniref:hypothetical protein n=1 Tax=Epibacterium ulvae TaxID=1156985 RepID=UPI00248F9016|nr:hypothetical protein [Epibacterium ulvae]